MARGGRGGGGTAVVAVLLALILLALVGGGGFAAWVWWRGEERKKDVIRIEQLDREIRYALDYERGNERVRRTNTLLQEQNVLVKRWPELGRVEQRLLREE